MMTETKYKGKQNNVTHNIKYENNGKKVSPRTSQSVSQLDLLFAS